MKKLVVAATAAIWLTAAPLTMAGPNDPMVFGLPQLNDQNHHTADPVDGQTWCGDCVGTDWTTGTPWVVNPHDNWPYGLPTYGEFEPGCMWDSDDSYSWVTSGNVLAAGATASVTECIYANLGLPLLATDVGITSGSPDLIVTEQWVEASQTVTDTIPAVFNRTDHQYHYFACIWSPRGLSVDQVSIPNSHGGVGVPQTITITVTNPTTQKIGKTGGYAESGLIHGGGRGCTTWINP